MWEMLATARILSVSAGRSPSGYNQIRGCLCLRAFWTLWIIQILLLLPATKLENLGRPALVLVSTPTALSSFGFPRCWEQRIRRSQSHIDNLQARRKAVAEFQLCVGHYCLGTHLHRNGIRPDPYCMLCSLHETMDRNHLRRCTALSSGTECERCWVARTKMMENWLLPFSITVFVTTSYY